MFHSKVQQCSRMLTGAGCSRCTEVGLLQGTPVRTRQGYREIEALTLEDELAVFPRGFRRLASIRQQLAFVEPVSCPACTLPVQIPACALGIHGDLVLQHDMRVVLTDPDLRPALGTSHISICAADLAGFRGIAFIKPRTMRLVVLAFDREEVITIDDGFRLVVPPEVRALDDRSDLARPGRIYPLNALQAEDYLARLDAGLARDEIGMD